MEPALGVEPPAAASTGRQPAVPPAASSRLSPIWRVDRRQTFEDLRRARRRRQGPLAISWVAGDPAEPPRVAYTIGRRVGPAVARNRLRRRLRMLMRQAAPTLRPGAYLLTASPEAASLPYTELEALVQRLIRSLEKP